MERKRRDGFPLYDREELIADAMVHAAGLCFAVIGGSVAMALAADDTTSPLSFGAVSAYAVALTAMFGFSAAYNLCPIGRTKAILRRCDHAAIFLLIAGTCTPLLAAAGDPRTVAGPLLAVWAIAGLGVATRLLMPRRLDRVSAGLYLVLGWGAVVALRSSAGPTTTTFELIVAGGILYSLGVVFHGWRRLRFHNAIWHGFVLIATGFHYVAVLNGAGLART